MVERKESEWQEVGRGRKKIVIYDSINPTQHPS